MSDTPRILFLGTPDFAVGVLNTLINNGLPIAGVVTVPDRPAGRGRSMRPSPVKVYALEHGLPLKQPEDLANKEFLERIADQHYHLGIVVAFRKLPRALYALPTLGTFNIHASLLPHFRGAAPIQWAIIRGVKQTGVTSFLLNDGIDTGGILMKESLPLDLRITGGELHDQLMTMGGNLAVRTAKALLNGTITPTPQPETDNPPKAPKLFRNDARLDFNRPAEELHNLCRALDPYPGAWCYQILTNGKRRTIKLFASLPPAVNDEKRGADAVSSKPGRVTVPPDQQSIRIQCGDGNELNIHEIQPEGKRRMSVYDFLQGTDGEELSLTGKEEEEE